MTRSAILIDDINGYIIDNLTQSLSVDQVAQHFSISKFHLHRLFYAHTGFDLGEYVVRRKMEHAVALLNAGRSGLDVALTLGYESHSAFSRAFKATYGISPSKADLTALHNAIILKVKKEKGTLAPIQFEIEQRQQHTIQGDYCQLSDMRELPIKSSAIFERLTKTFDQPDTRIPAGVSLSNPWLAEGEQAQFFFGFLCSRQTNSAAKNTFLWPAQSYTAVTYQGSYQSMWQFISRCHADIARHKQIHLVDRSIYQLYLNSPRNTPPDALRTKLFFPVQKKT